MAETMNDSRRQDPRPLRAATYNIHSSVGTDGRRDPGRIARVIRSIDPDLIGLQEVDSGYWNRQGEETVGLLERETGLNAVTGPTLRRRDSHYGNALLTRLPVTAIRRFDLSVPGYEPRGAIDVSLEFSGLRLRAMVTHFGLKKAERARQIRGLLRLLEDDSADLTLLFGDFNEWSVFGPACRRLNRALGRAVSRATFPSRFPLFRLDRIWCRPASALGKIWAEKTALSRKASDHLPLVAEISLEER
jgi:endonuclease/exonuclease/phosphatase family metal-dependent hydrolase